MNIHCPPPFQAAALLWQPRRGALALTVVCKATFHLQPGTALIEQHGEPVNTEDNHWDHDPSHSVHSPCDIVPFKPKADVVVVGAAFAPAKSPVRSLVARLAVGTIDKAIEVVADRSIDDDGAIHHGASFVTMPIRYERAAGGPETNNPVGVRTSAALPNLQPIGATSPSPGQPIETAGFGPIAPSWPGRRAKAGRQYGDLPRSAADWAKNTLPDDLHPGFFNVAPEDQQLDRLAPNERIVLENLHADHPTLTCTLPGLEPRVVIDGAHGSELLAMRADTLWIDTTRGICTLTFRGQAQVRNAGDANRIVVSAEWTKRMPIDATEMEPGEETLAPAMAVPRGPATPFIPKQLAPPSVADDALQTTTLAPVWRAGSSSALPFMHPAANMAESASLPSSPRVEPPEPRPLAPPLVGFASPWSIESPPPPARELSREAAQRGVVSASNAAAQSERHEEPRGTREWSPAKSPPTPEASRASKDIVRLFFFEPSCMKRVRDHAPWRALLAELELRRIERCEDKAEREDERERAREELFEVLVRGQPRGSEEIATVIAEGAGEQGRFEPPLVLVEGDVELPFDELSVLKATVAAMRPLSTGDKRLVEVLDAVEELAKTPWLEGSSGVADGLLQRAREAFASAKRAVAPGYVEAHTERILLERRCYQMRTLWGKRWIRSLVRSGSGGGLPIYLPEPLKEELPMFRQFRARVVAEAEPREDQYETHPCALKVLAMGRVIPAMSRNSLSHGVRA